MSLFSCLGALSRDVFAASDVSAAKFPEILGELDSGCPSQCQDIRLAAIWGHRRWRCAKNSRVGGTDTHQSVIGGLWNLGLVFRELSRKRTGGWYVENVHWRPPVRIRDGFVAARPISLAIATLFA
jgi:hypothetical protein